MLDRLVQRFTHFMNYQKRFKWYLSNSRTGLNFWYKRYIRLTDAWIIQYISYGMTHTILYGSSMIYIIWILPFGLGGMITALIAGDIVAWAVRLRASDIELIDASRRLIFSLELKLLELVNFKSWVNTYQFQQTKEFWSSWIKSFVSLLILLEIDKREKRVVQSRNHFA